MSSLRQLTKSESARLYRQENRDNQLEYARLYYQHNKAKLKADKMQYYLRNKDKIKEDKTRYYLENKDKINGNLLDYDYYLHPKRKEYKEQYYLDNSDAICRYRQQNVDKLTDYVRRRRAEGLDRTREFHQMLYVKNSKEHERKAQYSKSRYIRKSTTDLSWKTPDLVRQYFDSISQRLNILNFADWYRISMNQITSLRGLTLKKKFGNLGRALQFAYPEVIWDLGMFAFRGKKSTQRWLKLKVMELLPGIEIVEEYQHPDLIWEDSLRDVELDLWIPQHHIGIEYQGEQHYYNMENAFGSNGSALCWERDLTKSRLCKLQGITLISIPYWWDGTTESLCATLYHARPDVFPFTSACPIPEEMPNDRRPKHLVALPTTE